MAAGEQTGDSEFYRLVLAYDNFTNLLREDVKVVGHPEIICGNDAIRKQDVRRSACPTGAVEREPILTVGCRNKGSLE